MFFFILLLLIPILYLLAIKPNRPRRELWTPLTSHGPYYAHRGLHDNAGPAPENSMAAFRKAVEAGYGIELDVQLTKDRIPVVFHDETLSRVCGVEGKVRDYTFEELQRFPLAKSEERIPRFADVLELVGGRVPLILEIKAYENPNTVAKAADALICRYEGPCCVESFHPVVVGWYLRNRPEMVRGQLSSNFERPDRKEQIYEMPVHYLLSNFLTRPDFVAYDCRYFRERSYQLCRRLYRPLTVTWTVKSQEQLDACRDDFDLFIFEGFLPE